MRSVTTKNQEELRNWLSKVGNFDYPQETMCIGSEKDGELVGVTGFNNFMPDSCQIHVASNNVYFLNKWYLNCIFDYAFNNLKVKVILAPIYKGNIKSLNLCRKLGFVEVADIPYGHPNGDLIVVAMKRNQCRWLQ
jgi:RimJ/RimL family protein N-acetyltransferase